MLERRLNCQADGTGLSSEDYGIRDAGEVSHGAVEPSVPLSLPLILYRFFAALHRNRSPCGSFPGRRLRGDGHECRDAKDRNRCRRRHALGITLLSVLRDKTDAIERLLRIGHRSHPVLPTQKTSADAIDESLPPNRRLGQGESLACQLCSHDCWFSCSRLPRDQRWRRPGRLP